MRGGDTSKDVSTGAMELRCVALLACLLEEFCVRREKETMFVLRRGPKRPKGPEPQKSFEKKIAQIWFRTEIHGTTPILVMCTDKYRKYRNH